MSRTEQLAEMTNTEIPEKPEQLVETEPIENTPFHMVTFDTEVGKKHFAALGRTKLTDDLNSKDDVRKFLNKHQYEVMLIMILAVNKQQEEWKTAQQQDS